MDKETAKTKEWLDKRFAEGVQGGEYLAHQPIYGYKKGRTEGRDLLRYLRNLSILAKLSHFKFNSFIDIGGAEGYMANLVKIVFKVDSYTCDLSFEANKRAREIFGIDSVAVDLSDLPFKDEAFDVVLCSEVLEHVTNPVQAICELRRITRKALIITTEAVCYGKLERRLRMALVDLNEPHCDRNWFLADDFVFVLGKDIHCESTIYDPKIADKSASIDEAREILSSYIDRGTITRGGLGITVVFSKMQKNKSSQISIRNIADLILGTIANLDYGKNEAAGQAFPGTELIDLLRCPKCLGVVKMGSDMLGCLSCGSSYPVQAGIPIMYTGDKDAVYLSNKWNERFLGEFGHEYRNLLDLIKTFEHTAARPNFLVRMMARRVMKIEKFILSTVNTIRHKSALDSMAYLLTALRTKITREIRRVIDRVRRPALSDFKIGDRVEFAKDCKGPEGGKILVKQGAFGKIIGISGDNVAVKVEGVEYPVCLWNRPKSGNEPSLAYIKQARAS